jgi:hypothetical protein
MRALINKICILILIKNSLSLVAPIRRSKIKKRMLLGKRKEGKRKPIQSLKEVAREVVHIQEKAEKRMNLILSMRTK